MIAGELIEAVMEHTMFVHNVIRKYFILKKAQRLINYANFGLADPRKVDERLKELQEEVPIIPDRVVAEIFRRAGAQR